MAQTVNSTNLILIAIHTQGNTYYLSVIKHLFASRSHRLWHMAGEREQIFVISIGPLYKF